MYTDYNIDTENDLVYKNIIERSLGDLYTGMGWNEDLSSPIYLDTTFPTFNEGATIKYTKSDVDKFWLLSAQEVISLCLHYDSEEWVADFWIRSPLSSRLACILLVPTSGALGSYAVTYYIYAVRPAFKFSI